MTDPKRTLVIKFGGSAFAPEVLRPFAERVRTFQNSGDRIVVVHGGGKEITAHLERLGLESMFIDGLRVTDDAALEVTEMVLSGRVNKQLVRGFLAAGIRGVGIAGTDAALLMATALVAERVDAQGRKFRINYGHVGEVTEVHPALLETLLNAQYVPVVSPLALTAQGQLLNVNADTAAARIAGALKADAFLLLTDVSGVLVPGRDGSEPVAELSAAEVAHLKETGVITGGMIPKVDACLTALAHGARSVRIASLTDFLYAAAPTGTRIHGG